PLPGPPLGRGGSLLPKLWRIAPSPAKGRAGEGSPSHSEGATPLVPTDQSRQCTANPDRTAETEHRKTKTRFTRPPLFPAMPAFAVPSPHPPHAMFPPPVAPHRPCGADTLHCVVCRAAGTAAGAASPDPVAAAGAAVTRPGWPHCVAVHAHAPARRGDQADTAGAAIKCPAPTPIAARSAQHSTGIVS